MNELSHGHPQISLWTFIEHLFAAYPRGLLFICTPAESSLTHRQLARPVTGQGPPFCSQAHNRPTWRMDRWAQPDPYLIAHSPQLSSIPSCNAMVRSFRRTLVTDVCSRDLTPSTTRLSRFRETLASSGYNVYYIDSRSEGHPGSEYKNLGPKPHWRRVPHALSRYVVRCTDRQPPRQARKLV